MLAALSASAPLAFDDVLADDATWGSPHDPTRFCRDRSEVLGWYRRGLRAGVRARVIQMQVSDEFVVIGLEILGGAADPIEQWQVLVVEDDKITRIVGFDDGGTAMRWAEGRPA